MNKIIVLFSLITVSISVYAQSQEYFVTSQSNYNLDKTIELVKKNAEENGWKIPIVHELHKSVAKSGYEVSPVYIVEICNPELAGKVLEQTHLRMITPLMPIRFSIYTDESGEVFITRMNQDLIGKMLSGKDKELVINACSSADKILENIIKECL